MPGTPLPDADCLQAQQMAAQNPDYLAAYNVCHTLERNRQDNPNDLRYCRVLGFLLLNAPSNKDVRSAVTKRIFACANDADVIELGKWFEGNLLAAFRKFKSRTPQPRSLQTRSDSFEIVWNQMKADIKEAPKNQTEAKRQALIRDGGRCVVTGAIHEGGPADDSDDVDEDAIYLHTECAHIIPASTFYGVTEKSDSNNKLGDSSALLGTLSMFGYNIEEINGEKVHALTNVITLQKDIHDAFDRLQLYFESTPEENYYEVKMCRRKPRKFQYHQRQFVTLSTEDPIRLPVTSPELLALHACCCKVAYLSGAAEYIEKVFRDGDDAGTLASDGSDADSLGYMLVRELASSTVQVQG